VNRSIKVVAVFGDTPIILVRIGAFIVIPVIIVVFSVIITRIVQLFAGQITPGNQDEQDQNKDGFP
jgi:hypothetical protein